LKGANEVHKTERVNPSIDTLEISRPILQLLNSFP
jgi:hypothetical protein